MKMKQGLIAFMMCLGLSVLAGPKDWVGGDGTSQTAAMWSPSGVPASTDTIIITNGNCQYVAGGDCAIAATGSLTIGPGGRWYQTGGISWIQVQGNIILNGGIFDRGTAGNINFGGGKIIINSGTLVSTTVTFVASSNYQFDGGEVNASGREVQFSTRVNVKSGILGGLLASQNTAGVLNLQTGHSVFTQTGYSGFYQSGASYANFPEGSTAILTFASCTPAQAYARYFQGATPRIRYNDLAVSSGDYPTIFDVKESTTIPGGVDIALIQTAAPGMATFVSNACVASNLTTTSAVFSSVVETTGEPIADVFAYYGTVNGLLIADNWQNKVFIQTAAVGPVSYTAALNPFTVYYHRIAATNASGTAYASPTPLFVMTAPVALSAPATILENSITPSSITFSRPPSNNCTSVALTIPFTLGGDAVLDTHYTLSPSSSSVTIPQGAESTTLTLMPKADWASSADRTVVVQLTTNVSYLLPETSSVSIQLVNATFPSAPTNAWTGALSSDSTDVGNWSLGSLPDGNSIVLFSPEYAQRDMNWLPGMTSIVAAWSQPYVFNPANRAVIFYTTPSTPLTINGNCSLLGGHWTHVGPSTTPSNAVAVHVAGTLTVGPDAQIQAGNGALNQANERGKGYAFSLVGGGSGPGYLYGTGSSFGGEGGTNTVTYGSILNPLSYGSSGYGDNAGFSGAGLIVLTVAGTTTLNGSIQSTGFGYPGSGRGASTGGSINLTTASLLGTGAIRANGGSDTLWGSGSGGRIRVKLTDSGATFSSFAGALSAYGNSGNTVTNLPGSAAGTIALQTASDSATAASVIVDNNQYVDGTDGRVMATPLPPKQDTDASFKDTSWVLKRYGTLRVTQDLKIAALTVEGTTPRLFIDGFTLTVKALTVNGEAKKAGVYTAATLPAGMLTGNGTILVGALPTVIMIY
jgi:hypothetical protein